MNIRFLKRFLKMALDKLRVGYIASVLLLAAAVVTGYKGDVTHLPHCWKLMLFSPWGPCSAPCGAAGVQTRRVSLVPVKVCIWENVNLAPLQRCLPDEWTDTMPCNRHCRPGGTIQHGVCLCRERRWGECCEKGTAAPKKKKNIVLFLFFHFTIIKMKIKCMFLERTEYSSTD